jgi:hypothetical protein
VFENKIPRTIFGPKRECIRPVENYITRTSFPAPHRIVYNSKIKESGIHGIYGTNVRDDTYAQKRLFRKFKEKTT